MNETDGALTADQAWQRLVEGNERYRNSRLEHPRQDEARRSEVAKGQNPFAVVLGCADSRVPPEVVFDQGIGDLFVVRVAGGVLGDGVLGSLEFAVDQLRTPLLVVLAHSRCGAVKATLAGGELPGSLPILTGRIQPALEATHDKECDLTEAAIRANGLYVAEQLRCAEPVLAPLVRAGSLRVVAAHYDLDSGAVEVI